MWGLYGYYKQIDKWDQRFLDLAKQISTWSKDPSTQCGVVLVSPDRSEIIPGYNGFPKGMDDSVSLYEDREAKYSRIVHSDVNAILNAKRDLKGYTLYGWPLPPCDRCAVVIIQAGIKKVVAPACKIERWQEAINKAEQYYKEAGVVYEYV